MVHVWVATPPHTHPFTVWATVFYGLCHANSIWGTLWISVCVSYIQYLEMWLGNVVKPLKLYTVNEDRRIKEHSGLLPLPLVFLLLDWTFFIILTGMILFIIIEVSITHHFVLYSLRHSGFCHVQTSQHVRLNCITIFETIHVTGCSQGLETWLFSFLLPGVFLSQQ